MCAGERGNWVEELRGLVQEIVGDGVAVERQCVRTYG